MSVRVARFLTLKKTILITLEKKAKETNDTDNFGIKNI